VRSGGAFALLGLTRASDLALLGAAVLLTVLAFPPHGLWPLAPLMLAPLAALAERRGPRASFACAYLYALAMGLVVARWLIHALADEYGVARAAAWSFTALLVGAYALVPAGAAALHAGLTRHVGAVAAPLLFAGLWTLGEWLRAVPLGLPWLLAAQPLAPVPLALQTADLGGAHLPGFAVALAGAGLGIAGVRRAPRALAAPLLVTLAIGAYGAWKLAAPPGPGTPPLRVGVVQAAVPPAQRFRPGSALPNARLHVELTRRLLAEGELDLVVWPETAVDGELDRAPRVEALLRELVETSATPLLLGAPLANGDRPTNSAVLLRPGRRDRERYDKQRLVPFAESDPRLFGWLSPLVAPLTEGLAYVPGPGPTLLGLPGVALATPICFEITYPALVRRFHARGAELLVNLSNDAWFGREGGYAELHHAHAVLRAVELRTWVVRATNTGISTAIDPLGRVAARLGLFEPGTFRASVRPARVDTPYARLGDLPLLALLLSVPGMALVRSWRDGRKGR